MSEREATIRDPAFITSVASSILLVMIILGFMVSEKISDIQLFEKTSIPSLTPPPLDATLVRILIFILLGVLTVLAIHIMLVLLRLSALEVRAH